MLNFKNIYVIILILSIFLSISLVSASEIDNLTYVSSLDDNSSNYKVIDYLNSNVSSTFVQNNSLGLSYNNSYDNVSLTDFTNIPILVTIVKYSDFDNLLANSFNDSIKKNGSIFIIDSVAIDGNNSNFQTMTSDFNETGYNHFEAIDFNNEHSYLVNFEDDSMAGDVLYFLSNSYTLTNFSSFNIWENKEEEKLLLVVNPRRDDENSNLMSDNLAVGSSTDVAAELNNYSSLAQLEFSTVNSTHMTCASNNASANGAENTFLTYDNQANNCLTTSLDNDEDRIISGCSLNFNNDLIGCAFTFYKVTVLTSSFTTNRATKDDDEYCESDSISINNVDTVIFVNDALDVASDNYYSPNSNNTINKEALFLNTNTEGFSGESYTSNTEVSYMNNFENDQSVNVDYYLLLNPTFAPEYIFSAPLSVDFSVYTYNTNSKRYTKFDDLTLYNVELTGFTSGSIDIGDNDVDALNAFIDENVNSIVVWENAVIELSYNTEDVSEFVTTTLDHTNLASNSSVTHYIGDYNFAPATYTLTFVNKNINSELTAFYTNDSVSNANVEVLGDAFTVNPVTNDYVAVELSSLLSAGNQISSLDILAASVYTINVIKILENQFNIDDNNLGDYLRSNYFVFQIRENYENIFKWENLCVNSKNNEDINLGANIETRCNDIALNTTLKSISKSDLDNYGKNGEYLFKLNFGRNLYLNEIAKFTNQGIMKHVFNLNFGRNLYLNDLTNYGYLFNLDFGRNLYLNEIAKFINQGTFCKHEYGF